MVEKQPECKTQKVHVDIKKKVFDAELYTIAEALNLAARTKGSKEYEHL